MTDFTNPATLTTDYSVTVRVDRTGIVPHAFIILSSPDGSLGYGYHPLRDNFPIDRGQVRIDTAHIFSDEKTYALTANQHDAMQSYVASIGSHPGTYIAAGGLLSNNCVDFVNGAFSAAGLSNAGFSGGPLLHGDAPQAIVAGWQFEQGVISISDALVQMHQASMNWINGIRDLIRQHTGITEAEDAQDALLQGIIDGVLKQRQTQEFKNQVEAFLRQAGLLPPPISPLTFDLNGDGVKTTTLANGVYFDHDADGFRSRSGWLDGNDGLLALDINQNGYIDSGRELFGDDTLLGNGTLAANGYQALAQYDANHDGVINVSDEVFQSLRMWQDANHDGFSESWEIKTLQETGVAAISINYQPGSEQQNGNELRFNSTYTDTSGATHTTSDVFFASDRTDSVASHYLPTSTAVAALPEIFGTGTVRNLHQAMAYDTSGSLQALVTQYVANIGNADNKALLDQIIYKWAGTDGIDPNATTSGGHINLRTLTTLEAFQGYAYSGSQGQNNSDAINSSAWIALQNYVDERLIKQSFLGDFFNSQVYDLNNETWLIQDVSGYFGSHFANRFIADDARAIAEVNLIVRKPYLWPDVPAHYVFNRVEGGQFMVSSIAGSTVTGTSANDVIHTVDASNHVVHAGSGSDVVNTGVGNDTVDAGDGDDTVTDSGGNNTVDTGTGNDTVIITAAGDNIIHGGAGDDVLSTTGHAGWGWWSGTWHHVTTNSTLDGGEGNDILQASARGDNAFDGGAGDDIIQVMQGVVQIAGDAQDSAYYGSINTFTGGRGNDTLQGSAASDIYVFSREDGQDIIRDNPRAQQEWDQFGGAQTDIVRFGVGIAQSDLAFARNGNHVVIRINNPMNPGANDQITVENWFLSDAYRIELFQFADGASIGKAQVEPLISPNSAPIVASPLPDHFTDAGTPYVFDVPQGTFADPDAGDSLSYSATRADGTALPAWLAFAPATRRFSGTPAGADNGSIDVRVTATDMSGAHVSDTFRLAVANLITGTGWDTLIGTAVVDHIAAGDGGDVVYGGAGDDFIEGGSGEDELYGEAGNDTFIMEGDNADGDSISGGDGIDTLRGGAGDDVLRVWGFEGANTVEIIDGRGGHNVLAGSGWGTLDFRNTTLYNIDLIDGGPGGQTIYGSQGGDVIQGGADDDHLEGGLGNDTYVFNPGDGEDSIVDSDTTSGNQDKLYLGVNPLDIVFVHSNDNLQMKMHGATDTVTVNAWYSGSANHVERIRSADNHVLLDTQVDQLIQAMANFSAAHGGTSWDQAIDQNPNEVQNVLAAYWQAAA